MTSVGDIAELYRRHADELVRYATVLVGPHDASDVVTDAVLQAQESRAWVDVADQRAYLFRCVHNRAVSMRRSDERRTRREERSAATPAPATEATALPESSRDALRALATLSPQQRAVVYLTYWEDRTPAWIAEHLGIGEGSVRKQLARAREQLRTVLR